MAIVFLGLGSNLGDRERYLRAAIDALKSRGVLVGKVSTVIETEPVGGPPQGKFLNAVVKAKTALLPEELLDVTQAIERRLGRMHRVHWGPRVIDIDILLYGDIKFISRRLMIPHPRMLERPFVMKPLQEISPGVV